MRAFFIIFKMKNLNSGPVLSRNDIGCKKDVINDAPDLNEKMIWKLKKTI